MGRKRSHSARFRVGKVTGYLHHGAWWLYYREDGKTVRRKVALNRDDAEKLAAQINGQAAAGTPTLLSFDSIGVAELRKQFLEYHELALKSSMGTVRRYRARLQAFDVRCEYIDGRPAAADNRPADVGVMLTAITQLRQAVRGSLENVVVALPHLDVMATTDGGWTTISRELVPLLYEAPQVVLLGFRDPSLPLLKVVDKLFPRRYEVAEPYRGCAAEGE